ncbi:HPr family phosphocarrier protein [Phycisphaera mikurensis]|uniref:Phosphocarrier protein HPr n=1 Tax=Phycisphaera mikurensis (strain NBRC 102666 / KCTC 22515 / FYK2301M01) TaxID=1142394 RepID=I0IIZ8_PHYMF|nr:HPr family phosphocarrier protein [Phycisphaera mikurensis]MBB6443083.1 phosphocarrier protein [Phycisphaera mikurensis]BAM05236.1 phosphocarrier protein HPr [Phycisphaera mikurensis NBRC 102666]
MPTATARETIAHRLGMHARPAMGFVDLASGFASAIRVGHAGYDGGMVDGKSIMHLMMLAATEGTVLEIEADGEDAQDAVEKLCAFIRGGFGEG